MSSGLIYWGNWKGRVIKAIAVDGAQTWDDIRNQTGLTPQSLNQSIAQLMSMKILEKIENSDKTIYRVENNVCISYREHFGVQNNKVVKVEIQGTHKTSLIQWIEQWKELNDLNFSTSSKHFYLQGTNLAEFAIKIIGKSAHEIIVVTPFIEALGMSETFKEAAKKGVNCTLITRVPKEDNWSRRQQIEYLNSLISTNVNLYFHETVHAKLIIVDRTIGIASSMNVYAAATAAKSWEAGLISFDEHVIEDMLGSVLSLIENDQTTKAVEVK